MFLLYFFCVCVCVFFFILWKEFKHISQNIHFVHYLLLLCDIYVACFIIPNVSLFWNQDVTAPLGIFLCLGRSSCQLVLKRMCWKHWNQWTFVMILENTCAKCFCISLELRTIWLCYHNPLVLVSSWVTFQTTDLFTCEKLVSLAAFLSSPSPTSWLHLIIWHTDIEYVITYICFWITLLDSWNRIHWILKLFVVAQ